MNERAAPPRRLSERSLLWLGFGGAAVALLVAFWPALRGEMFVYGDLGLAHLPERMFFAENLAAGRSSLWLPNLFCGFFLHGDGQVGMYHPLHWLFYRWLPLPLAFNLECSLHYPLILAGTYGWLRRLRLPQPGALFGAITFAFSGFLLVRMTHVNVVAVLAHLPWLLWALDIALRDPVPRKRHLAWIAIAVLRGSQVLLGYPGSIYLSLLCEGAFVLAFLVRRPALRPLFWLAGANALGLGLGAVQLLPTAEMFGNSYRANTTFEYLTQASLHPLSLVQPLAPYLYRDRAFQTDWLNPIEPVFYLGAVVPVATLWVAARWRALRSMHSLLFIALGLSGVGVALALGRYNPLYVLYTKLPLVGSLRVPARHTLLVTLAGALVSAIAFSDLWKTRESPDAGALDRAWWLWFAPVASALIATSSRALPLLVPPEQLWNLAPELDMLVGVALATTATVLWLTAAHGSRLALTALLVFSLADLVAYGTGLWHSVPPATLAEYEESIPRVPVAPPDRFAADWSVGIDRNESEQVIFSATTPLIVHDTRLVRGYAGLMPERKLDYTRTAALRVASVALVQAGEELRPLERPLPRFRLVSHVVQSDDPATAIERIDVSRTAVVETQVSVERGRAGRIEVRRDEAGDIALGADVPTRQFLVVSEAHHAGWKLAVDGTMQPVLRAYGDFMGFALEPGRHEVSLRFEPQSVVVGGWISLVSAALVCAALLATRVFDRARSR